MRSGADLWSNQGLGNPLATAISMLFSEAFEVPLADMLAAEQHHWELAGPEAYPLILCAGRGTDVRQIEPWEFQLLQGCVLAIPDFVKQHPYSSGSSVSEGRRRWPRLPEPSLAAVSVEPEIHALVADPGEGHDCDSDCDRCED